VTILAQNGIRAGTASRVLRNRCSSPKNRRNKGLLKAEFDCSNLARCVNSHYRRLFSTAAAVKCGRRLSRPPPSPIEMIAQTLEAPPLAPLLAAQTDPLSAENSDYSNPAPPPIASKVREEARCFNDRKTINRYSQQYEYLLTSKVVIAELVDLFERRRCVLFGEEPPL